MRKAILVALTVSLVGCGGARSLGGKFKKLGGDVAKTVKPIVPNVLPVKLPVKLDANVDVVAIAKSTAKQQAHQRVANIEPITITKSVHKTSSSSGDAPAPAPEPVITHTTVDTGIDQVWKNTYRTGEKATCEKVDSFESCQATCSEHMRQQSMNQLNPKAGKPVNCECTQGHSKC